ncbi:MAG: HD domain-containing protein [Nitrospirae bacterium]|nr:HD domain-containing protein [Nitrospirota bacterium]MBF0590914.1 HD domain-containing protein [Nitrospirota bacterium]
MKMRRVNVGDIPIGKPLAASIYDEAGHLMLRKGYIITEADVVKTIQGLVATDEPDKEGNAPQDVSEELDTELAIEEDSPFEEIDMAYVRLENLFRQLGTERDIRLKVLFLANMLMHSCAIDEDLALGTLLMKQDTRYTIKHPLHTAIVCEVIAKQLGWSVQERLPLLSAAITMNIAMIELQEMLHYQKDPLTDKQRLNIQSHPLYGMEFLMKNNVRDTLWLKAVLQHHETIDGKGYPKGLTGEDVSLAARIIYLADLYCARVTGRDYRPPLSPAVAMKDIFLNKGQKIDTDLAMIFIKNLGIYPPGSFVKLKNNEIAVVTQRGEKTNAPIVHSVVKSSGFPPLTPLRRDTSIDEFSVTAVIPHNAPPVEVNRYQLWGYGVFKKPKITRRKRDRLQTNIPAKLLDLTTIKASDVVIINISENGCLLKTSGMDSKLYVIDKSYYITFKLLEKVFENIECVAKNSQIKDGSQFLGISFTDATDELKNMISFYIDAMRLE